MKPMPIKNLHELCEIFTRFRNRRESLVFLKDILTKRELASVVERWQIIKRLGHGMTQRRVSKELNVSIDKVTRGAKALRSSHGGFRRMLKKD